MRTVNDAAETITAAASAVVSAESRIQRDAVQKRRWGGCRSFYCCFGFHRSEKRISHAVFLPETPSTATMDSAIPLPFAAPPSSPASFLHSEPPSAAQSPACLFSLSRNTFSPADPASIFAIGPYAHETQLVTPPALSGFNTEPSTAPFTPPPESVLTTTTPSSPEVPFAQMLTSSLEQVRKNGGMIFKFENISSDEFPPYDFRDLNPRNISGSSSPHDFKAGSGAPTPDGHMPETSANESRRLSFELSGEEVARDLLKNNSGILNDESENHEDKKRHRSITFGSVKDFNFESFNDGDDSVSSKWWANEEQRPSTSSNWTFFPVLQPEVI